MHKISIINSKTLLVTSFRSPRSATRDFILHPFGHSYLATKMQGIAIHQRNEGLTDEMKTISIQARERTSLRRAYLEIVDSTCKLVAPTFHGTHLEGAKHVS